ncbi:MAG: PDZ domain-containing protein [Candidatus Gastranaerophilales bacterium]|nr:PDZ domain-containing protein [Candidatus Gastranaerophilales bacterium]MCM1072434.1 PDZ domain-containing protein [Bacteroides sp.]
MKKFILPGLIGLILFTGIASAETQICGIGANLVQDPYNKKVFVFKTLPNSMALKYGLPEGAEIISINEQKVRKLNLNQATELIRGEEGSKVKLTIKYNKEESTIEIPRAPFKLPEKVQDKFEIHWKQIAPVNARIEPIPLNMLNNMSKKWYAEIVPFTNYWLIRKAEFKNSYDVCMSYPAVEQNACLINLTNREINKTSSDEQLEVQQNILRQQSIQNSINAVNQIQMNNNLYNINSNLNSINNKIRY